MVNLIKFVAIRTTLLATVVTLRGREISATACRDRESDESHDRSDDVIMDGVPYLPSLVQLTVGQ